MRRLALLLACATGCDHLDRASSPPAEAAEAEPPASPPPAPPPAPVQGATRPVPPPPAPVQGDDAFCRRHPSTFEARCGGIGPLHIPMPPSLLKANGQAAYQAWQASLTSAQRAYVARICADEDEAMSDLCGGTPLVLVFDDAPVELVTHAQSTDWPTARTPWLALDRDGSGAIDRDDELFGPGADHGFVPLAALDDNHDARIDRDDAAFAALLLWSDRDGDRASTPDELSPLSDRVLSLSLDYRRDPRCDDRLNCEGERAPMTWRDATGTHPGAIVDLYLHYR